MENIIKIHTVAAVLLISIMFASCFEQGYHHNDTTADPHSVETAAINSEVMWGMGKTFDEIAERYGDAVNGNYCTYSFENGYGMYTWGVDVDKSHPDRDENVYLTRESGGCKSIAGISAGDLLTGDLSAVNLDNISSKYGFETIPINPMYENYSPNDDHRFAYYTHPSYKNIMFVMCYKKSGFDEDAMFRIRYENGV